MAQAKNPPAKVGDAGRYGFDPWVVKIPWRRHSKPTQYSHLENSMWIEKAMHWLQSMEFKKVGNN